MYDRRSFLARSVAGTAALAGLAGCLDAVPGTGGGDRWIATLADPRPAVLPGFHVAYDCDVAAVLSAFDDVDSFPATVRFVQDPDWAPLPAAAGRFLTVVDRELDGVDRDDLERATGHYYRQAGLSDLGSIPLGEGLVVTGSIPVGSVEGWLDGIDVAERFPDEDGTVRYGIDSTSVEGFAATDDRFAFGSRTDAAVTPSEVLDAELAGGDGEWLRDTSPSMLAAATALDPDDLRFATGFDLVAERPDTGQAAFDAVLASLLAAAIGVDVDDETTTIERLLQYREGTAPDVDAVEAALDLAAGDEGPILALADDPTIERRENSVSVTATVSTDRVRDAPATLGGLPFPGYGVLSWPINPSALGRTLPPRVRWTGGVTDDGHATFEHAGGPTVEDVVIRYRHDGDDRTEEWPGPVAEGDTVETASPVEPGTTVTLRWRPGTPDETVLAELPVSED